MIQANASTIYFYGDVCAGDSVQLPAMLAAIKSPDEVHVRIASDGGDVMDGLAAFNLLRADPRKVIVWIDGMAGSIASVIAMAGDTVNIAGNAFFFLHNALSMAPGGNAAKLREKADVLDKITPSLLAAYMAKAKDEAAIRALMDAESYVTASEAVALGLADAITESMAIAAISPRFMQAAASLSKPTAGNENPTQENTKMADTTPAVDPAKFDALTAKVDALTAAVEKLTGAPAESPEAKALAAKAEKAESDLVALRKDFDAFVAKAPTSAAFKPDGFQSKAKTVAEIKAEYHGIKDPLEKARFMAAHKSAF